MMDSSNARRRVCTRLCLARLNVTANIPHRDRVQIAHTPTLARTQPVDLVVPIVPFVHIFSPRWVQRIPEHKFADKRGALRWRYFVPRLGLLPERFHPYLQLCGGGLCMFVCVSETESVCACVRTCERACVRGCARACFRLAACARL